MKQTFDATCCPICDSQKVEKLQYINEDYSFLTQKNKNIFINLNIHSCQACGFSYAYPFIQSELLDEFYENEYSSEGGPHFEIYDIGNHKWKNYFNSRVTAQFMLAAQYIDLHKIKNFLDIGCGHGVSFDFLNNMKSKAKYYAMEGGKKYQKRLNELNVNIIDWNNDSLCIDKKYDNFFDLILISHVLEHFNAETFKSVLTNINKYLKSGGALICEVPNDDSSYNLLESINHAPHLIFFSQKSLFKVINDCGFKVKYISSVGDPIIENKIINTSTSNAKFKFKKNLGKYNLIKKALYLFRQLYIHLLLILRYYFSNTAVKNVQSNNFIYGNDRNLIRVCALKK